jgi:hypothetical protein
MTPSNRFKHSERIRADLFAYLRYTKQHRIIASEVSFNGFNADVVGYDKKGMFHEFEIKVSFADFKHDFDKAKFSTKAKGVNKHAREAGLTKSHAYMNFDDNWEVHCHLPEREEEVTRHDWDPKTRQYFTYKETLHLEPLDWSIDWFIPNTFTFVVPHFLVDKVMAYLQEHGYDKRFGVLAYTPMDVRHNFLIEKDSLAGMEDLHTHFDFVSANPTRKLHKRTFLDEDLPKKIKKEMRDTYEALLMRTASEQVTIRQKLVYGKASWWRSYGVRWDQMTDAEAKAIHEQNQKKMYANWKEFLGKSDESEEETCSP